MKGTLPLQGVGGRSTEEVALNVGELFPWEQARKDVLSCGYNAGKGSGTKAGVWEKNGAAAGTVRPQEIGGKCLYLLGQGVGPQQIVKAEGGEYRRKEVEEENSPEAAVAVLPGGEARDLPGALQTPRRMADRECPLEVLREQHPLQYRWGLWFFRNDRSRAWQDNLQLVTKLNTVEDFWATYSHIKLASKLSSGCDYALFKDGIQPMWEDNRNKRGGRWLLSLAKQQRHIELDRLWLETLLCLLGESFEEHGKEVCGAVVNIRAKGDKIAVWTSEAENQAGVMHIGHVYKERLGLSTKTIIGYQAHTDTAAKSNSLAKNKFVV
ncbi:eukaryotic translation initiation factor 4E type 1B [Peromyscus leucopus]|uniref:eukaryotic translation initiation factor 4E type 1B n=1 Tax=Peromyscus leucopus TaxID=10041 RepID=UPI0010A1C49D|nr:eukaryotic translation initiation factor 4E type 1B [Peromyscus leucopus]